MKSLKIVLFLTILVLAACKKDSNTSTSINITGTWVAAGYGTNSKVTIQLNVDSTFTQTTTVVDATGVTTGYISVISGKYHFSGATSSTSPIVLTEYNLTTLQTANANTAVSDPGKLTVNSTAPGTVSLAVFWNGDNTFGMISSICVINNPGNIDCAPALQFKKQ